MLQAASESGAKDVFLFDKSHLRPNGRTAPEEQPKPLEVEGTSIPLVKEDFKSLLAS